MAGPSPSVQERTAQIFHRDGHVLFNAATADGQPGRDFGVTLTFKFVEPEHRTGSFGQHLDRTG